VLEPAGKRQYVREGEVFILESLSDSVVRVTRREQTEFFGIDQNWDPSRPYKWTTVEGIVHTNGIVGSIFPISTPDEALRSLCAFMLATQRREDTRRINPEERKRAACQVLAEFMDELPEPGPGLPDEEIVRMGREIHERDTLHLVEPDHDGEVISIDVDSGRWAVAGDTMEAVDRLREMQPGAVNILSERVGYKALFSFGGSQLEDPVD